MTNVEAPNITVQFDQIMQQNFGYDPVAEQLNAAMEMQTAFGDLSLDNAHTAQVMASERGMNALMAPSFVADSLAAYMLVTQAQEQNRLWAEEDEKNNKKKLVLAA